MGQTSPPLGDISKRSRIVCCKVGKWQTHIFYIYDIKLEEINQTVDES